MRPPIELTAARPPLFERAGVAVLILGGVLAGTCGLLGLFEPTETRYAEIAREMLASGDWLIPRLDGIAHFHKPPLAYWAAAEGMALFGTNAWGARLAVALAALATLTLVATAAARRFQWLGVRGSRAIWVLGSMLLFAVIGRALASDPFLTAAVTGFWALAPSSLALAALGVGFLAKGPVVFVHTVLPVLVAALWARDRRMLALLGPPRGWLAFALVALPWYVAVVATNHSVLGYLLGNQLWARVATETHGRSGPPWYFVAAILLGTVPWTAAMLTGLVRTWRDRARPEARLVLCWLLAPIVFLSFSGSKLPAYLLPCLPAAALLAARGADTRIARWGVALTLAALAITGLIAGGSWVARLTGTAGPGSPTVWGVAACLVLLAGAIAAARARVELAALLVVVAVTALGVAAMRYESALGSPRLIARLLADQRGRGEPVVEVGHFNAGLPFYLGERVWLVEVPREANLEGPSDSTRSVVPRDSLATWTYRHGRVWTFGRGSHVEEIARDLGLGYVGIARWRKESLGFLTVPRGGTSPRPRRPRPGGSRWRRPDPARYSAPTPRFHGRSRKEASSCAVVQGRTGPRSRLRSPLP